MLDLTTQLEFRPELLSRRAEGLTWLLALVMGVTWWLLQSNDARYTSAALLLLVFLVFAAVGTSLSNWIERNTEMQIDQDSIRFKNGLRDVRFTWGEIKNLRVLPSQAGSQRVQVLGEKAHFEFRTLAELKLSGVIKGQSGFKDGDRILQTIITKASLIKQESDAPYAYYARE